MKRKKITGIIAAILAASVLMSACVSDKKPRRDRDDDDDATPGFTRNTTEETEPNETGVAPGSSLGATWDPEDLDPNIADAYVNVLMAYEQGIRDFEAFHSWSCPAINLIDLDGDGVPELTIKYVTEPYYANFAVFSYNQGDGQPCLRLETMGETDTGSWGASNDIVLLDDGTIMISNFYGSGGEYHYHIDLFETSTYSSLGGSWECEEQMPDMSNDCVPVSAQHGGIDCSTDDFYEAQADMVSRIVAPIFPYSSRCYYDDYSVIDIFGRDWNMIPGSVFAQGNYIFYDGFMAACGGGVPVSTQPFTAGSADEAYQIVLNAYHDEMMAVEEYTSVNETTPCCALCDITGDGEDELFILYSTDSQNGYSSYDDGYVSAALSIFTYDDVQHCAVNMYTLTSAVAFGGSGRFTDVVMLDNGNLLFFAQEGDLEFFETTYVEFEVSDNELNMVNIMVHDSTLVEWDPEEVYEDEFLYNYDEIVDEAFADYVNDYIVRSETAIFVSPWYSENSDNGAWGDALLNLPCEAETYMDAVIELNV